MEGEQKPIRPSALARHFGCSPAYVTKLVKSKGMPEFFSLADADAWRAVNAPPKKLPQSPLSDSAKNPVVGSEKNAVLSDTTTPTAKIEAAGATAGATGKGSATNNPPPRDGDNVIDVTRFITPGVDFDALMIRQAEGVPQVAHGLYELACQGGNPLEIAAALKNWNAAAEASAEVRAKFLELQEKTGAVISLDLVMDVVGTELQAARAAHLKLGERCATDANPADPALAQRVIDAAVDAIWAKLFSAVESMPANLTARAAAS